MDEKDIKEILKEHDNILDEKIKGGFELIYVKIEKLTMKLESKIVDMMTESRKEIDNDIKNIELDNVKLNETSAEHEKKFRRLFDVTDELQKPTVPLWLKVSSGAVLAVVAAIGTLYKLLKP